MSQAKRKLRSNLQQQRSAASHARSNALRATANRAHVSAEASAVADAEFVAEQRAKELERRRRKSERRLDELERGRVASAVASWNENSSAAIPAASTSAAAIAGLLAGREAEQRAEEEIGLGDTGASSQHQYGVAASKKKQSAELKRLLGQRRGLKALLEDANASPLFKSAPINFVNAANQVTKSSYPSPSRATAPLCTVCGYLGDYACMRCHERFCSLPCRQTHDETRCERPA